MTHHTQPHGDRYIGFRCPTTDRWTYHPPATVRILKLPGNTWVSIHPCTACPDLEHAKQVDQAQRTLLYSNGVAPIDLTDPEWSDPARTNPTPLDFYDGQVWLEDLDDAFVEHHGHLAALAGALLPDLAAAAPTPATPPARITRPGTAERLVAQWRKGWRR